MNKIQRCLNFLGIVKKAGKLKIGETLCNEYIKRGKVNLLIIAEDASKKNKEYFIKLCEENAINYLILGTKELLGRHIGKRDTAYIAITDYNMAKKVEELLQVSLQINGGDNIDQNQSV